MDNFHEEIIVRKNKMLSGLLYILLNVLMVVLALIAAIFMQNILTEQGVSLGAAGVFLASGGLAVLIYFSRNFLKVDYEYTFTNGIIDIAKVINNKKRKELLSFHIKDAVEMAPIFTNGFNKYQSMTDVKKINAFVNRDNLKYFIYVPAAEEKKLIVMEPSDTFVELCKKYNMLNVKVK
jgi:hypothetical protein